MVTMNDGNCMSLLASTESAYHAYSYSKTLEQKTFTITYGKVGLVMWAN